MGLASHRVGITRPGSPSIDVSLDPGSAIDLRYKFVLTADLIAELLIAP